MASSLPVIASDIAGNSDLVSHGVNGILFDSDDDEELARAILSLVDTKVMRDEMGATSRSRVLEHHQIHHRVKRMTELYLSLLAAKTQHDSRLRWRKRQPNSGASTPAVESTAISLHGHRNNIELN
jgi:hypothetical protein